MPSFTSPTSANPSPYTSNSTPRSRSHSPPQPPYSPITPTLSSARLPSPRPTYSHTQAPQTAIPQPKPIPIQYDENPDVLALKSAAAILQLQARNAVRDIQALQRIKERAGRDPEGFVKALEEGEINKRGDPLFSPRTYESGGEEGDDVEMSGMGTGQKVGNVKAKINGNAKRVNRERLAEKDKVEEEKEKWEPLPTPQNVVRCPPINWNQYAVVGESLEKLHRDQVERPSEGVPQRVASDGSLVAGGEGYRRQGDLGIAAPYQPGRDKIEKMGTRKGGKR